MRLDPARLSFNQITANHLSLEAAVEACAAAEIGWFGPWRHKLVADAAARIRESGLRVSSLCRGGFFPADGGAAQAERARDNRIAVEQAAELAPTCWCWCAVRRRTAIWSRRGARCWKASRRSSPTPPSAVSAWASSRFTR